MLIVSPFLSFDFEVTSHALSLSLFLPFSLPLFLSHRIFSSESLPHVVMVFIPIFFSFVESFVHSPFLVTRFRLLAFRFLLSLSLLSLVGIFFVSCLPSWLSFVFFFSLIRNFLFSFSFNTLLAFSDNFPFPPPSLHSLERNNISFSSLILPLEFPPHSHILSFNSIQIPILSIILSNEIPSL